MIIFIILLIIILLLTSNSNTCIYENFDDKNILNYYKQNCKNDNDYKLMLKKLRGNHKIMTNMLKNFHNICEKHNIKYWLIAGSLIGSLRHGGFIPWDNDIDIAMLKEDFIKFKNIGVKELPTNIFFQDPNTDYNYNSNGFCCQARLRDENSCLFPSGRNPFNNNDESMWHQGFQLDIFVSSIKNNKIYVLSSQEKGCDKKHIFFLKKVKFENITSYIPNDPVNFNKYVQPGYTDWKKLPPKEKRYPHEPVGDNTKTCKHHSKLKLNREYYN